MVMIWIIIPSYAILLACFTTNIVDNVCYPWRAYNGPAAEKSVPFLLCLIEYLLPLSLMIFWYSRIVYALRTKVTAHCHDHSE